MLEATRKAARRIFNWYCQTYDKPNLFVQVTPISAEVAAFLGGSTGPMDQAIVVGTREFLTLIRTSGLDHARGPVPCQPFEVPGSLNSSPMDWSKVVAAVLGKDIDAEIGYGEGTGQQLIAAGKVKVAREIRWPVLTIVATRRAGKLPDGERALQHEIPTRGLAELGTFFTVGTMAGRQETIFLRTKETGHLMRSHAGRLEFRGLTTPVVLRSQESEMVSFIQPAPAPLEDGEKDTRTDEEITLQRRLPGFEDLDDGDEDGEDDEK